MILTYKYIQAYTTLDLVYDGTQFIVVGNPVLVSTNSYSIYADGKSSSGNGSTVYTFSTREEALAALAIEEGEEGYIPDNAMIVIDEDSYVLG